LKTARTKIDVYVGTLSMEFGDTIAHFNILDAMKHPSKDHSVFRAELIDDIVDEYVLHSDSLHGSICESDLQVEVQGVEPILLHPLALSDVQPAPTS